MKQPKLLNTALIILMSFFSISTFAETTSKYLNSSIESLTMDAKGTLYIGKERGLSIKEKDTQTVTDYAPNIPHIATLAIDANGTIYGGSNVGFVVGKKDKSGQYQFQLYSDIIAKVVEGDFDNEVNSVYIDKKGLVYAGGRGLYVIQANSLLGMHDTYTPFKIGLDSSLVTSLYVDENEIVYAGTQSDGLFIGKRKASGEFVWVQYAKASGLKDIVSIYVDQGIIYAGTDNGLFIGKANDKGQYIFSDAETNSVLGTKYISTIYAHAGKIYIGTVEWDLTNSYSGLIVGQSDDKGNHFFSQINSTTPEDKHITSLSVNDAADIIYIGTSQGIITKKISSLNLTSVGGIKTF